MNALTTTEPVSAQTLEHVLGTGDLSKLTTDQRVEFYKAACHSLGLNPLTRPIRFLSFQGQMQAYFTRDGTDQLRKLHNISLHVVDQNVDAGLYVVRVQAKMPSGRSDEDIGAVVLPQSGESRANALMKATTKAKRRVTLSICGLGWSSEDELDTMPGAVTFDAEDEAPPVAPIRAVAAGTKKPDRKVDSTVYEAPPQPERKSWTQWADTLEIADRDTKDTAAIGRLIARAEVAEIVRLAQQGEPTPAKSRIMAAHRNLEERYLADPPQPPDEPEAEELPDLEIVGADKLAG